MTSAIPNALTLLRIALTPFVLIELAHGHYLAAGWIFGGAAATDILDGGLARALGGQSKLGQYLDPVADKLLLTTVYIGLVLGGAVPFWVVGVILSRDLWILLMSLYALRFTDFRDLTPNIWGKLSTFLQIMAAIGVMAGRAFESQALTALGMYLLWGVVLLAALSGISYTLRGIHWYRNQSRRSPISIDAPPQYQDRAVDLKPGRE